MRTLVLVLILNALGALADAAEPAERAERIVAAFRACHQGYSTDELLIRDDLRACFLSQVCQGESIATIEEREILLELLRLRKTGKLTVKATKRGRRADSSIAAVAEIAARAVIDRHRVTTDTMLADPRLRREFQAEAELIAGQVDSYAIRKAVLSLRKKRALRPELVLQVTEWGRQVTTASLAELRQRLAAGKVSEGPGVYLFRNPQGYLYVGEAADLAARLSQHLDQSDRQSLAEYLAGEQAGDVSVEIHAFDFKSPAAKVSYRRAYESELIRSRQPRFNVRP